MSQNATLKREYFDSLYTESPDPWSFATSDYEAEKYARSLDAIPGRYLRALEIGCSIGVFTQQLARQCAYLIGIDISNVALERARLRCAAETNVTFEQMMFPREWPAGSFDLITCCEVGYYWSDADLAAARDRIADLLDEHGDLLLVHFLPEVEDYVRTGDAVHEAFLADARFSHAGGIRAERYRLDVLRRLG